MNNCFWYLCSRNQTNFDKSKLRLTHIPKDLSRHEKQLLHINLQYNQIANLDESVFRCKKLERLYLNDNCLQQIPDQIGELTRLEELYLSRNSLVEISNMIEFCEKLLYLDLSNNDLKSIPQGVTKICSLQVLLLNENVLSEIPYALSSLSNLREFEARSNHIKGVPESISFLTQLTRLDLGCNEISSLPVTIGKMENLRELWLDNNAITELPQEIGDLKNLEILELSNNPLGSLPSSLCELENLTHLTLTGNPVSNLPENFGNLKQLKILKAEYTKLKALPDTICDIKNLNEIHIPGNMLTSLPENMGRLKLLRCLHLDYNKLTCLPESISECSKLSIFSMRDNLIQILPTNIGNLSKLTVLDLCENKIKFLPYSILKLKKIRAILLSNTQQKSMYPLQTEVDPEYGKVLTNFLLPQNHIKHSPTSSILDSDPEWSCQKQKSSLSITEIPSKPPRLNDIKDAEVLEQQPKTVSDQIEELCLLNSQDEELFQNLKLEIKTEKSVNFEKPIIEDFSTELVRVEMDSQNDFGLEFAEMDPNSAPYFAYFDSSIIISDITIGSTAFETNKLRVGDRVLEINEVSVSPFGVEDAMSLLKIKEKYMDILVRHDPPKSHFKMVIINKETIDQKLGFRIGFMLLNKNAKVKLLTILEMDSRLPDILKNVMVGDIIVEANNLCMLERTSEDFIKIVESAIKIELVIYRRHDELILS